MHGTPSPQVSRRFAAFRAAGEDEIATEIELKLVTRPEHLRRQLERVAAVRASEAALDPAMTAGAALRRSTRSCVDQIVGNEAAVLAGMPEGVHQMRVGVRRLRAILSAFSPLLKNSESQPAFGRVTLAWRHSRPCAQP